MRNWLGVGAALAIAGACGGKAIVDGKKGSGGAGGAGASTASTVDVATNGSVTNGTSTAAVSGVTGGSTASGSTSCGSASCQKVCTQLYQCGLKQAANGKQLCPGFQANPMKEQQFLCGGGNAQGCGKACDDQPALAAFVDPSDCKKTIDFIKSASADFANICTNGF